MPVGKGRRETMKSAVFLDRDGTIVRDGGYSCDYRRISIYPFTTASIRRLNDAGIPVVVVTNQSAVARGICTPEQVEEANQWIRSRLSDEGARIDAFYCCPFHPEGRVPGYVKTSPMRKPAPGMLQLAAREMDLDLGKSVMIGDKLSDIAAGAAAGCRTILVRTGYGESESNRVEEAGIHPRHVAVDLREAVSLWLEIMGTGNS